MSKTPPVGPVAATTATPEACVAGSVTEAPRAVEVRSVPETADDCRSVFQAPRHVPMRAVRSAGIVTVLGVAQALVTPAESVPRTRNW